MAMDARGARHLAARIAAGVRVGGIVELLGEPPHGTGLQTGDRGTVQRIASDGEVLVAWHRGFSHAIDPQSTAFRSLRD
jgi:hypothetical protein